MKHWDNNKTKLASQTRWSPIGNDFLHLSPFKTYIDHTDALSDDDSAEELCIMSLTELLADHPTEACVE